VKMWRPSARRQPALARLASLLATAGARAGARLVRRRRWSRAVAARSILGVCC